MSSTETTIQQEAQHYRPLDRTLPEERLAQAAYDLLCLPSDATQAALHTAVQSPINSLTQMVAPKYLPNVQIIDAPEKVAELSPRWHAQQLGSALGAAADIAAIEVASRGTMPPSMIGLCYDGLLRPVDLTQGQDQWEQRVQNSVIGSLGLGTLYGSNKAIGSLCQRAEGTLWKNLATNTALKSTLAGIPAGLVTTALSGGTTVKDFALGTYTSALSGLGLGAIHAASERQALNKIKNEELAQLKSETVTDHLTGLGNRRGSDARMQQEFDRSLRTGKPLSVIYGDLDGFKKVNDDLGHETGDQVLIEVGHRLQQQLRSYDHAARTGGDEFTLILPETDLFTAKALAGRLEKAARLQVGEGKDVHAVGISLGVVTRAPGEDSLLDFQKRADQEMYRSKRERKNQFNL